MIGIKKIIDFKEKKHWVSNVEISINANENVP